MRYLITLCSILACLFISTSCSNTTVNAEAQSATQKAAPSAQAAAVDCDALMQQLADSCFDQTVFAEDGSVNHVLDDDGNDLGEIDQMWVADYCECFAQIAFQTFGCMTIIEHEKLDDATYEATYANVINTCNDFTADAEGGDNAENASPENSDAAVNNSAAAE